MRGTKDDSRAQDSDSGILGRDVAVRFPKRDRIRGNPGLAGKFVMISGDTDYYRDQWRCSSLNGRNPELAAQVPGRS